MSKGTLRLAATGIHGWGQPYHKGRWRRRLSADSGVGAFGSVTWAKLNLSVLTLVS